MRLFPILLVLVVAVLSCCDSFASATKSSQTKISMASLGRSIVTSHDAIDGKRFLRTEETTDTTDGDSPGTDDSAEDSNDTEERGVLSSLTTKLSNLKTKASNSIKTSFWANLDKSDDAIRQKLGLEGLTGRALTSHNNYKVYQQYEYKIEGRLLDDLLEDAIATSSVWKKLRLRTDAINMAELKNLKNTPEFKTYMRYARKYERWAYSYKDTIFEPPRRFKGPPGELLAKAEMWAQLGRSKRYVLDMLGQSSSTRKRNQYYIHFLRTRKALKESA